MIRDWLAEHLPAVTVATITPMGGADNVAYDVNGELIVRVRRLEADVLPIADEARLLEVVGRQSLVTVPRPLVVDATDGVMVYPIVRRRPLPDASASPALADALAAFLTWLHAVPLAEVAFLPRDESSLLDWRDEAASDFEAVAEQLTDDARRRVAGFLTRDVPPATDTACLVHNDLGAEHVLVDAAGALGGVIDWTDAVVGDPALDIALLLRDFGLEFSRRVVAGYGGRKDALDETRALFYARCALLEDMAYGDEPGVDPVSRRAFANVDRLFA